MSSHFKPLALKYRPTRFSEVVGQEAAARVLRHAVSSGQVHSAYLFYGSRGSGKTSVARILACALNCARRRERPKDYDGEPCGECVSCRDIASGRSLDVLEIDAASHTGVDNVREVILDTINLAPARDLCRVFIIDEVHMLSTSAFNAMLKTLEEPPANVVFILATTEFAKLPATVVSRTHSFLFRPLPAALVRERIFWIAKQESITVDEEAASEIARASGGSLRDAVSLLQQVMSLAADGKKKGISREDVVSLLGLVDENVLQEFLRTLVFQPDILKLKKLLEDGLYRDGYPPAQLLAALHRHCAESLIAVLERGESAAACGLYELQRHLSSMLGEVRWMPDPILWCEAGLLGFLLKKTADVKPPVALAPPAAKPAPVVQKPGAEKLPNPKEPDAAPVLNWEAQIQAFLEEARRSFRMYLEGAAVIKGNPAVLEVDGMFQLKGLEAQREKLLMIWRRFFPNLVLTLNARHETQQPAAPETDASAQMKPAQAAEIPEDVRQIAEMLGGKIKKRRR